MHQPGRGAAHTHTHGDKCAEYSIPVGVAPFFVHTIYKTHMHIQTGPKSQERLFTRTIDALTKDSFMCSKPALPFLIATYNADGSKQ